MPQVGVEGDLFCEKVYLDNFANALIMEDVKISQSILRCKIASIALHDFPTKKAAAEHYGISPSHLGEIMAGTRDITDAVAQRFGYTQDERHFVKIGDAK